MSDDAADSLYTPDPGATSDDTWDNAFLTNRDVSLYVPINFHTTPGTSLRAACFANNQYEDGILQKCLSNLLAVGFRRFTIDAYWDAGRSVWSLCPVELPISAPVATGTTPAVVSATNSVAARGVGEAFASAPARDADIWLRQDGPTASTASTPTSDSGSELSTTATVPTSVAPTSSTAASSTSETPGYVEFPSDNDSPTVIQVGQYNCTSTANIDLLSHVFSDWAYSSELTTNASVLFLSINVHAAAPGTAPDSPAQQPRDGQSPAEGNWLSDVLTGNLSKKIYTPQLLEGDRKNLNDSWYDEEWDNLPALGFYNTFTDGMDKVETDDGWPSESFMEFGEFYRIVADFGDIDPQMADYNLTTDLDIIFPQHYLRGNASATVSANGAVSEGCLFNTSQVTNTGTNNASWAVSLAPDLNLGSNPSTTIPIPAISNITLCGYSPFLNYTLSNTTADANPIPYMAFARSTIWTWAPDQPTNTTQADNNAYINTCAAIFPSGAYPGRWNTVNCNTRYRIACYNREQPYNWTISAGTMQYFNGNSGCPNGYQFSHPHTALEGAHVLAAIRASGNDQDPVFVNFNCLDVPNCWTAGINGTCPYQARSDQNKTRVVVVPTVAAVIIFVLAALTFFVKCAANRREGKRGRRRRQLGGWEYEGVPS